MGPFRVPAAARGAQSTETGRGRGAVADIFWGGEAIQRTHEVTVYVEVVLKNTGLDEM